MARFAFHGPLKSGKTTLALALQAAAGHRFVDYTGSIKRRLAEAMTVAGRPTTEAEIVRDKEQWRELIVPFATKLGCDYGNGVFEALRDVFGERVEYPQNIAFDNVRFQSQYDKLKPYGFILVRLSIYPLEQERRVLAAGGTLEQLRALRTQDTERPLPTQRGEIRLNADTPTEDQVRILLRLG
jgi:hypothetical protein